MRNWLYSVRKKQKPAAYTVIWDLYNEFLFDFDKDMELLNIDPTSIWELPFTELADLMASWIKSKAKE